MRCYERVNHLRNRCESLIYNKFRFHLGTASFTGFFSSESPANVVDLDTGQAVGFLISQSEYVEFFTKIYFLVEIE